MYNFVFHSNKILCRRTGRIGLDPVVLVLGDEVKLELIFY